MCMLKNKQENPWLSHFIEVKQKLMTHTTFHNYINL